MDLSVSRSNRTINCSRYFCHKCDEEKVIVTDELICPTCNSGFIEEVIEKFEEQETNSPPYSEHMDWINARINTLIAERIFSSIQHPLIRRGARGISTESMDNFLNTGIMGNVGDHSQSDNIPLNAEHQDEAMDNNSPGFEWNIHMMHDLVHSIDGPPPLNENELKEIPLTVISQDHIDKKLQCSICFEDFTINEVVMKLVCDHIYHKDCITPWLKLHATCPICRTNLGNNEVNSIHERLLRNRPVLSASARFARLQMASWTARFGINFPYLAAPQPSNDNIMDPIPVMQRFFQTSLDEHNRDYSFYSEHRPGRTVARNNLSSSDDETMDTGYTGPLDLNNVSSISSSDDEPMDANDL